jgi:hypothetical protein
MEIPLESKPESPARRVSRDTLEHEDCGSAVHQDREKGMMRLCGFRQLWRSPSHIFKK